MLNRFARPAVSRLAASPARLLLRVGVTPDAVTVTGAVGVVVCALLLYPRGELWWGSVLVAVFALADVLDGSMARLSGGTERWGALLDSTLDRAADAAVLAGLVVWFLGAGGRPVDGWLALGCLVLGFLVPYVRARAESLGWTGAAGGVAERADRLILVLVATAVTGLGAPAWVLTGALAVLLVASAITVAQRLVTARHQARSG